MGGSNKIKSDGSVTKLKQSKNPMFKEVT